MSREVLLLTIASTSKSYPTVEINKSEYKYTNNIVIKCCCYYYSDTTLSHCYKVN